MNRTIADRYELGAVVASGGMATVWRARDTRLDRDVAIKRPHPTAPDDPERRRLVREAKAAASIAHPNIVTVYDAGEDEDGPYLVMELVEAPSLVDLDATLGAAEAIGVVAQVAKALDAVHRAGIVHRDVKPSNILMPPGGPQLTDFGIAHNPASTQTLTAPETVLATPQYAAPEVLAGGKPTPSADVFSLAVVAYELLSGKLPFDGTERSDKPPPLGDASIDAVLAAALSPDPAKRPEAATFGKQLGGVSPTIPVDPISRSTPMSRSATTLPMATVPPVAVGSMAAPEQDETPHRSRRRFWVGAAVLALLMVVAAAAATLDNGETLAATVVTSTTLSPSTSTTSSTSTTTSTTTTTQPAPTVESARAEIEDLITAVHPSNLKPKEARSILKKIDEAIERSAEGEDDDRVADKLSDARDEIEKKLDGDPKTEVLEKIDELSVLLGVEFEDSDDESD